ncbi:MAG: glycosyltransferase [Chitinophagaceae bacterium]|nr:MAG: glycosyltransferase [Chitinophagaceae bacterium]
MKLSIITVCYNNLEGIKKTYRSLENQLTDIEWVVIDGDSKDGTKEYINDILFAKATCIVFVSEPDKGIFDAMNKGIAIASGEFVIFLNSGDTLDYSLTGIIEMLNNDHDVFIFGIKKVDESNRQVKWSGLNNGIAMLPNIPLPHQSSIIRRSVFLEIGSHDLKYQILGDHDFFCRAYVKGYRYVFHSNIILSTFYMDGVSSKLRNASRVLHELRKISLSNFGTDIDFTIRMRYRFRYIISWFPFSGAIMRSARNLVFKGH